jgi:hypothetical protein
MPHNAQQQVMRQGRQPHHPRCRGQTVAWDAALPPPCCAAQLHSWGAAAALRCQQQRAGGIPKRRWESGVLLR